MSVTIYPEEPASIPVEYSSNPLTIYGYTYSDIENIVISIKRDPADALDAYLAKYYKEGGVATGDVLLDEANHKFTLVKSETDVLPVYAAGYNVFIGVKVTALTKYLWLRVSDTSKIIVEEDGINI